MAAVAPTQTDRAVLDAQITDALFALRLARVVTARGRSQQDRDAENRAEANLNSLLDHRHDQQH